MATLNEQIEGMVEDFGVEVEVTGGGKGWTAKAEGEDISLNIKAASKADAIQLLRVALSDAVAKQDGDEDEIGDEDEDACSEECQSSTSAFCQCKCGGILHGAMVGNKGKAVMIGDKPCKCGCGQTTKRTFVAGHDAKYHGLVALRAWAKAEGLTGTDEELRKAKAAAMRKAARERRAAKRADVKVKAEAVAAAIR
jgi:hypothetical protein